MPLKPTSFSVDWVFEGNPGSFEVAEKSGFSTDSRRTAGDIAPSRRWIEILGIASLAGSAPPENSDGAGSCNPRSQKGPGAPLPDRLRKVGEPFQRPPTRQKSSHPENRVPAAGLDESAPNNRPPFLE